MEVIIASPWVPVEWVRAHGHEPKPVWLCALNSASFVSEGVCPVAEVIAEIAGTGPAAAIIPTTCDQMRRAAHSVRTERSASLFLFNVPATWQTATARKLYHNEMERLGGFLVSIGGQAPSCSDLAHTASQFNEKRIGVYDSMREHPEEARTEAIARVFECGSTREPKKRPTGSRKLVPVALLGGALFAPEWPLLDAVETAGGLVVVNGMEPGERCLVPPVPISDHGLTMACLADHYFDHIVDVFPRPNSQLYSWLAPRLQERKARGIILWVRVGCDLWRAEAASLRETFRLPVLVLDSHRLEGLAPGRPAMRDLNRISAFIESLQ